MPVHFGVICVAVIVTGKTVFLIRTSETLGKTPLLLHFLM